MELSKCVMNNIPGEGMSHSKVWGEKHRVAGGKTGVLGKDQVMDRGCSNPPDGVGTSSRNQWETIPLVEKNWWDVHFIKPALAPGWWLEKTRLGTGRPVRRLLQMRKWVKVRTVVCRWNRREELFEGEKLRGRIHRLQWLTGYEECDIQISVLRTWSQETGEADHEKGMRALLADRPVVTHWNS